MKRDGLWILLALVAAASSLMADTITLRSTVSIPVDADTIHLALIADLDGPQAEAHRRDHAGDQALYADVLSGPVVRDLQRSPQGPAARCLEMSLHVLWR